MRETLVSMLVLAVLINFSGCTTITGEGKKKAPSSVSIASEPNSVKVLTNRPAVIPAALAWGADGCLDTVNDKPAQGLTTIVDKAKVKLIGWAGNLETGTVPQDVYLEFEGPVPAYFKIMTRLKRPDVVAYFKKPGLMNSGWVAYVNLTALPAGIYKVKIIQIEGKTGSLSDIHRSFKLVDSISNQKNKSSKTK